MLSVVILLGHIFFTCTGQVIECYRCWSYNYFRFAAGLYFTLNGTVYQPENSILITDIGVFAFDEPGMSLVCVTSNVNTECCRTSDGGNVGEWYFPNGTIVPRNSHAQRDDGFARSGFAHQVRLNRRNNATSPTGTYECRVPDGGTRKLVNASIILG